MIGLLQPYKVYWQSLGIFVLVFFPFSCISKLQFLPPSKENEGKIKAFLKDQNETLNSLLQNYDKRLIPAAPGLPLVVKLGIVVADILKLENMEIEMVLYIRQEWYDYRLKRNFTGKVKTREHFLDKIWIPDLRIIDLKEIKRFDGLGGVNMNIHPDGRVYYSQVVLVKVDCPMDLHNFPMDRQTCVLNFASFAYAKSMLVYMFGSQNNLVRKVHLPEYDLVALRQVKERKDDKKGLIAVANIELVFQRRAGYYILQIYIPATFLVLLSWLSFLMGPLDIADRLALEITMILSIVFLLTGINESIPHVSYAKASDWFVVTSFTFIFLALLETMLVYRIKKSEICKENRQHELKTTCWCFRLRKPENNKMVTENGEENHSDCDGECHEGQGETTVFKLGKKSWSLAKCIDGCCIIAFPLVYIGFSTFYWLHFMTGTLKVT